MTNVPVPARRHRPRLLALLLTAVTALLLVPAASPASAASSGGWSMTIAEGGNPSGWTGTPTCAAGGKVSDRSPDHVVVDPRGTAGFVTAELRQTGSVGNDVHTRTTVKLDGKQSWYNLVHHGSGGNRLLSTVEQALSYDLSRHPAPFTAIPAVGQPARWSIHTLFTTGTGTKVAACEADLVVWAAGDRAAPANAVRMKETPHPQPHKHVQVDGLAEQFGFFVYPRGPGFARACNGTTPHSSIDTGDGAFRLEPDAGGLSGRGAPERVTSDVWAFVDLGHGSEFDWRQRSPDLPSKGVELSQASNRWGILLPNKKTVQDYAPVTWMFQAHFHKLPAADDLNGLICAGSVTVR